MDFRQFKQFSKYLESSGWKTARLSDGTYVYIFNLPILGTILRIPRPKPPIKFDEIDMIAKRNKALLIKLEPDTPSSDQNLTNKLKQNGYIFDNWSIEPTNTLIINLKQPEQSLFKNIRSKWQKYIRLSQKKGVEITPSDDIDEFIRIWQENAQSKGYIIENPSKTRAIWHQFRQAEAAELLFASKSNEKVAGIFLIFSTHRTHLWHMAYDGRYEKLHPMRLLIWKSILYAKSLRFEEFDFEGIKDPRLPYTEKLQPTFFKQGFGGFEKQYIGSFVKYLKPLHSLPFIIMGKFKPDIFRGLFKKFYG